MLDEIIIEEDQVFNLTRSILRFLEGKDVEIRFYKKSTDIWEKEFLSKYLTETVEYFGNIFKAQAEEKFDQKNLMYFKGFSFMSLYIAYPKSLGDSKTLIPVGS